MFEWTDGMGAEKGIEVVGFPAVVEEGLKMVSMRGTYLEVGHISPNSFASIDMQEMVSNQIRFYGIQHYDPWIIPNAIDFLERTADRYPLMNVVSHEFPLDQIGRAFETAEWLGRSSGSEVTRAVVTP